MSYKSYWSNKREGVQNLLIFRMIKFLNSYNFKFFLKVYKKYQFQLVRLIYI